MKAKSVRQTNKQNKLHTHTQSRMCTCSLSCTHIDTDTDTDTHWRRERGRQTETERERLRKTISIYNFNSFLAGLSECFSRLYVVSWCSSHHLSVRSHDHVNNYLYQTWSRAIPSNLFHNFIKQPYYPCSLS